MTRDNPFGLTCAAAARHGFPARAAALVVSILVLISGCSLGLHAATAQMPGVKRTDLQRHDLSVAGREVIQSRVEFAPGAVAQRHSHPGEEVIYVLEGTLEYQLEGEPPVTLQAGEVLFVPARTIHSAKNVGRENGAELATYVVEKGQTLVVPAQ